MVFQMLPQLRRLTFGTWIDIHHHILLPVGDVGDNVFDRPMTLNTRFYHSGTVRANVCVSPSPEISPRMDAPTAATSEDLVGSPPHPATIAVMRTVKM
jgi:hypothetical protein